MAVELPHDDESPAPAPSPSAGLAGGRGGPVARARQAASVIVVRDRRGRLELLLVKRNPGLRFMGGVWVFPGGAVDPGDGEGDRAHRAAGVRELAEEAGIEGVDPDMLVKFSRWITPAELDVRFDTHFFIARLPEDAPEPRVDGRECVADAWFTAQGALDAHANGAILLVLPTIRQLEQLRGFQKVEALIDQVRDRQLSPTAAG